MGFIETKIYNHSELKQELGSGEIPDIQKIFEEQKIIAVSLSKWELDQLKAGLENADSADKKEELIKKLLSKKKTEQWQVVLNASTQLDGLRDWITQGTESLFWDDWKINIEDWYLQATWETLEQAKEKLTDQAVIQLEKSMWDSTVWKIEFKIFSFLKDKEKTWGVLWFIAGLWLWYFWKMFMWDSYANYISNLEAIENARFNPSWNLPVDDWPWKKETDPKHSELDNLKAKAVTELWDYFWTYHKNDYDQEKWDELVQIKDSWIREIWMISESKEIDWVLEKTKLNMMAIEYIWLTWAIWFAMKTIWEKADKYKDNEKIQEYKTEIIRSADTFWDWIENRKAFDEKVERVLARIDDLSKTESWWEEKESDETLLDNKEMMRQNSYSRVWRSILKKTFGWVLPDRNNNVDTFINDIWESWKSYSDLFLIFSDNYFAKSMEELDYASLLSSLWIWNWLENSENNREDIFLALSIFLSDTSKDIIKSRLAKSDIEKMISSWKLEEFFGEEFVKSIKWKDYKSLNINQISILLAYSFPLAIWSILVDWFDTFKWFLFEWDSFEDDIDLIRETFSSVRSNYFSDNLWSILVSNTDLLKWNMWKENFNERIWYGNSLNPEEKKQIDRLNEFKEEIVSKLDWNESFSFWEGWFSSSLEEWINYLNLIELYLFLDWKTDLDNLDLLSKSSLYIWILSIINTESRAKYIYKIFDGLFLKPEDEVFKEEEKQLMLVLLKTNFIEYFDDNFTNKYWHAMKWLYRQILKDYLPENLNSALDSEVWNLTLKDYGLIVWFLWLWSLWVKASLKLRHPLLIGSWILASTLLSTSWILSVMQDEGTLKRMQEWELKNLVAKAIEEEFPWCSFDEFKSWKCKT